MGEEALHHFQILGLGHGRQAADEDLTVGFVDESRVAHHEQTGVPFVADQASSYNFV